jgi:hypothetical protein
VVADITNPATITREISEAERRASARIAAAEQAQAHAE